MENISKKEKNKLSLQYGLVIGAIYLVITTAIYTTVNNWLLFNALKVLGYILYIFIIAFFAKKVRKANGGFIEFKELFGAVFIMILVGGLMSFLYNYLYINVIDTAFLDKLKNSTVSYMEHAKIPSEKIDETANKFDKQMADAKTLNLSNNLLTFFGAIVIDSIFGMVICLVVKKDRPMVFNG